MLEELQKPQMHQARGTNSLSLHHTTPPRSPTTEARRAAPGAGADHPHLAHYSTTVTFPELPCPIESQTKALHLGRGCHNLRGLHRMALGNQFTRTLQRSPSGAEGRTKENKVIPNNPQENLPTLHSPHSSPLIPMNKQRNMTKAT